MESLTEHHLPLTSVWDDEHVKALLHFPRFPVRLIQHDPWQSWIGQRGGLRTVIDYLHNYPFQPSHRRILEVVLSTPESVADVYADRLNISRATYFYQLRELIAAIVQALNHWEFELADTRSEVIPLTQSEIPAPLTNLIGAENTIQVLTRLISREDIRLLTLLGPGGIGKTRLSIELARRSECETCFIELSGLNDPELVVATIAKRLGVKDEKAFGLIKALQNRNFLLVLDNFERLLPARKLVSNLLTHSPRLKIIVTSRITLKIYGEHEFVVPPLAIADIESVKGQQLWAQSPAVTLFVQRAQAVNPNFSLNNENVEAVTELCQRMEGLPLAIELAAYQVKYFSPKAMLNMSNNLLDFLNQGTKMMPPHQQTLRDMLDWSFDLLSPELQNFFCQLSIFPASFSISEVESACGIRDAQAWITALVDQSLLEQTPCTTDCEPRFKMLGMVRDYALERSCKVSLQ